MDIVLSVDRHVLYTGSGFDPEEVESALEAVTAKTVREACMKYIYDKCPAVVGYGKYQGFWNTRKYFSLLALPTLRIKINYTIRHNYRTPYRRVEGRSYTPRALTKGASDREGRLTGGRWRGMLDQV